jgi:hypothetical protein
MEEHVDFEKNRKDQTWIWVAAGAVVLCLCCAVLGVVGAAILFLRPVSSVTGPGPAPVEPTAMPFPNPTPVRIAPPLTVVVDPVDPDSIPLGVASLYDLFPNYQGLTEPGQNDWQTSFSYDRSILIFSGWCTSTTNILEQNFEHLTFLLEIDGQDVPVQGLTWADAPGNDGYCRSFYGMVAAWPVGTHAIVMTMRFDADINDGWGDYSAGDYVDLFEITATP